MTDTAPKIGRPQLVDGDGVPTRERILAAALRAFVSTGYEAATLGDIARDAQVSAPAIYNHFSSKSELFIEAARTALNRIGTEGSTRDNPRVLLALDADAEVRHARRLLVEFHTAALRHPELDATLAEWQQDHIERWVAQGHGTPASARAYYLLVQGLALMDAVHIDPADDAVRAHIDAMVDTLFPSE